MSMKAPDKIYLGIQDMGSGYVYALSLDNNGEQEYVRKDTLLEWAVYMRDKNPFGTYEYSMFQHMIDKLNEM